MRWILQYSLVHLIAALTAVCIALGLLDASGAWDVLQQRRSIRHLSAAGLDINCVVVTNSSRTFVRADRKAIFSAENGRLLQFLPGVCTVQVRGSSRFSPESLRSLASLRDLKTLELTDVSMEHWDLRELLSCGRLRELELINCNIADSDLEGLTVLSLDILRLDKSTISDVGMRYISQIQSLRRLSLAYTAISTLGLSEVLRLHQLQELDLEGTWVDDDCLDTIRRLKKLRSIVLTNTEVSPAAIDELRAALPHLMVIE